MRNQVIENLSIELKRGVQIIAVLTFLKEPQYGYSLLSILEKNDVNIESGTLYPLLRRLESQGLLTSSWDTNESRPRKFYVLNKEGIETLEELIEIWVSMQENMNRIILGGNKNE
ncbi:PadR family transcriptional regulator [Haploplasma axanthum]|uniref:Lineage-specific thermal regulator protein n=1 Tax=Haploplasma axanthum TaxID=29552 RepID=A0A449BCA8_HAPAX|nr:PadR family transcriptional regulator [Haploplasma axanthum]VEU79950.1 lineage-specific thermal regulator protein [Haploplasma axanthum]